MRCNDVFVPALKFFFGKQISWWSVYKPSGKCSMHGRPRQYRPAQHSLWMKESYSVPLLLSAAVGAHPPELDSLYIAQQALCHYIPLPCGMYRTADEKVFLHRLLALFVCRHCLVVYSLSEGPLSKFMQDWLSTSESMQTCSFAR